ncbi:MAG: SDR family NAD(P)-dependent oxidoreductase [Candidatus Hydrogenedentes bacterium]|nr:SDR family NAD(P)-dependent oxidoreductase [Candidatus Hydrogenedentota bacterium]
MSDELRFDGRIAIVTGAGSGLGRAHALLLASRGAAVVVNDLGGDIHGGGEGSSAADKVVAEIKAAGGEAVANYDSVENGEGIVQTALDTYKRLDIVINNAGILRDVSFHKMTDEDWDRIYRVHLEGTYKVTHAAWPHLREQQFGRVVNTTSDSGIFGNFGQANYSAAKLGILGLSNTLAHEGHSKNIHVNTIAPIAGSRLTETVLPPDMVDALKPEYVSPLVAWLCHDDCTETGGLFEVGAGWYGKLRWQRSKGASIHLSQEVTIEGVKDMWSAITDWTDADYPKTTQEAMAAAVTNLATASESKEEKRGNEFIDPDKVLGHEMKPATTSYTERDLSLYALGIGAAQDPLDPKELQYVYELSDGGHKAFPTFGVTIPFGTLAGLGAIEGLTFDPMMLLHGEQYLELPEPLPEEAVVVTNAKVKHVYDKGKGAVIVVEAISRDADTEKILAINESTIFIRGIGNFGGDRGPSGKLNVPPDRKPDAVEEEKIADNQALLYRLSGDRNPLHADPSMAALGGFDRPILHGLCFFGFAARAVLKHFGENDPAQFKSIKVRFAKHVFPGETLITEMWKESDNRIIFQCKVAERDEYVITNAAMELQAVGASASSNGGAQAESTGSSEVEAIFAEMSKRIKAKPELVGKVDAVFQFNVDGGGTWTVDLKNGEGSVQQGAADKSDCTISMAHDDFVGLMTGKLDGQQAFMQGKLKVTGNMMLATKLSLLQD